ncbi:MAG: hypothetical protein RIS75_759 [Actinomycetota bacterium]
MSQGLGGAHLSLPSPFGFLHVWLDEDLRGVDRWGKESSGAVTRLQIVSDSSFESRDTKLGRTVSKLLNEYLAGDLEAIDEIAVAQLGTGFRQEVWLAMRSIEAGTTDSYAGLAQRARRSQAFRAAASACSNNAIPLIVPCHRVITSSGAIGNYYYGTDLKINLLQHEGALKA